MMYIILNFSSLEFCYTGLFKLHLVKNAFLEVSKGIVQAIIKPLNDSDRGC